MVKSVERPNVLFIAIDDLRPELGCYGRPVLSPNIDRLAATGTLFKRAYVQQALCKPSRASILTGRRPDATGVTDFTTGFRDAIPDAVTLPQHFMRHGYHARAFGKIFHNDDKASWSQPLFQSTLPQYRTKFGLDVLRWIQDDYRRIKYTWHLGNGKEKYKRAGGLPAEAPDVADNELRDGHMTEVALAALDAAAKRIDAGGAPFFLAVGYMKPHLPFVAPKNYFDLYDPDKIPVAANPFPPRDVPYFAMYNFNDMRHYYGVPKIGPVLEPQARRLKHAYYACVSYVDALIGRLLRRLDDHGLSDNTVVVLWGDHGWQLGEHGIWDKHTNFETSTHAPLILRVPGQKPGVTDALVEHVDIYPTLAEACGLPVPRELEGTSLLPLTQDPDRPWKSAAFSQYRREIPEHGTGMGYSM
ncbi:MAG: sulfatase, partial [Planctomycetota bacterium]